MAATRAAVEEGIVAGGGTAFINAIPAVEALLSECEGDEKTGVQIVLRSLEEPVRNIASNDGVEGSVIVNQIKDSEKGVGYNALTGAYMDMLKEGIVDPTKVTRSALENAASVGSKILTTESLVADKPDPAGDAAAAAAMAGAGGGMY